MPEHQTETRYYKVADTLRREITSGALKPGDRLPSFPIMRAQGVSQNTMERAHTILEREGLIVREAKRGVFVAEPKRRQALGIIGVVSAAIANQHPYYAHLLKGVQDAAHRNHLEVLLLHETSAIKLQKVDGLLIHGRGESFIEQLPHGMACVSMLHAADAMPHVTTDDRQGIRDAMNHLLELGHRRIGYLTAGFHRYRDDLSRDRLLGYFDVLEAAGLDHTPKWLSGFETWGPETSSTPGWLHGLFPWEAGEDGFRGLGRTQMTAWLRNGWSELGCTAVLAQNDDTAIGVIEALHAAGYRVPQDVSVVGFDGAEAATYFSPRLTTVQVPLESVSSACVDLLVEIIARQDDGGAPDVGRSVVLPTSLRIGESTGPAPQ